MLRTMLVGLDGSRYSHAAVELGIRWAQRTQAMLVGLGIVDEPGVTGSESVPLGAAAFKRQRDTAAIEQARDEVDRLLEQFSLKCAEAGISSKILEDVGPPARMIAGESQRFDLILLGQRTDFDLNGKAKVDITLPDVLRISPRPVVVVPDKLPPAGAVLIAYDGSLHAARTLQLFVGTGLATGLDVHVLTLHEHRVEAARCADRAVQFLDAHEIRAKMHALEATAPPEHFILEQAAKLSAGLIVMGAYGQPTLREFFFGSVTDSLLKRSPVPLFVYH
jgi:nucleotide-binding universal stress UspA family protein